jgi:murein hydrolase activator
VRRALLALLCTACALGGVGPGPLAPRTLPADEDQVSAELAAARRTRDAVAEKLGQREAGLRGRVRALYKLSQGGLLPLWVEDGAGADLLRRRGAARRILVRDLEERAALRAELAAAQAAVDRLEGAAADRAVAGAVVPPPRSLARPVPGRVVVGFGRRRDPASGVTLVSRGVDLAAPAGVPALAPLAGVVTYAGPVRGLGAGVVVDHGGGLTSVVAGLSLATVARGQVVSRGDPLGVAGGPVHIEIRRAGRPVDPAPLLRAAD